MYFPKIFGSKEENPEPCQQTKSYLSLLYKVISYTLFMYLLLFYKNKQTL